MRPQVITRTGDGNSNPAILDVFGGADVSVQVVVVSGTPNWTVQQTLDDPNDPDITPTWLPHPTTAGFVAQTGSAQGAYPFLPRAVRLVINSGGGVARMTVLQAGAPGDR